MMKSTASAGLAALAVLLAILGCSARSGGLAAVDEPEAAGDDVVSVPARVTQLGFPVLYPAFMPPGYELISVDLSPHWDSKVVFVSGPPGATWNLDGGNWKQGGLYIITMGVHAGAPLPPFGQIVNPHERIEVAGRSVYLIQGQSDPVFSLAEGSPERRPTGPNGEELLFEPIDVLGLDLELDGFLVSMSAIPPHSSTPEVLIKIAESLVLVGA